MKKKVSKSSHKVSINIDDDEAAADQAKPVHSQKRKAKRVQMLDDKVEELADMHSLDGSIDSRDSVSQSSQSLNSGHEQLKRVDKKLRGRSSRGELGTGRKPKLDANTSDDESHGSTSKVNEEAEDSKEQHDDETLAKKAARRGNSKKSST